MKKGFLHLLVSLFLALRMLTDSAGFALAPVPGIPRTDIPLFSAQALSAPALGQIAPLLNAARVGMIQLICRKTRKWFPPPTEPTWRAHPGQIPALREKGERLWRAIQSDNPEVAPLRGNWDLSEVAAVLAHRGKLVLDQMALVWPEPTIHVAADPLLDFFTPAESETPHDYHVVPIHVLSKSASTLPVYSLNEEQVETLLIYLAGREDGRLAIARLPTMPEDDDDVLPSDYWRKFYGGPEQERPRYHFDLETRPFIRAALIKMIGQMPEPINRPFTLLHAGAGKGELLRQVRDDLHRVFPDRRFQFIGIDLNAAVIGVEGTEGDLTMRTASATDEKAYPEQAIDLLLDSGLMSHDVISRAQAVRILGLWATHLVPGGLIVSVPFAQSRITEISLPASLQPVTFSLPERMASRQRPWVFITLQKRGDWRLRASEIFKNSLSPSSPLPYSSNGLGQKALSGKGFTPEQARAVAAELESRKTLKPRVLEGQELARIADAIERLAKDRTSPRARLLQRRLGMALYYKYFEVADWLRKLASDPTMIVTVEGDPYHVQLKSIPGDQPLHHEGEWSWGFPVKHPAILQGKAGTLTQYVADVDGFEREPDRLAGILHSVLEYNILPQDERIQPAQRHAIAFVMEALAGGEILNRGRLNQEVVLPLRAARELELIPTQAAFLKRSATEASQRISAKFLHAPFLLFGIFSILDTLQVEIVRRTQKSSSTELKQALSAPEPTSIFTTSGLSARNFKLQREATAFIQRMDRTGQPYMEIYASPEGRPDFLPVSDALMAAKEGFLFVDTRQEPNRLFWGSTARLSHVGPDEGFRFFSDTLKIPYTRDAVVIAGKHRFTLRSELDRKTGQVQLRFYSEDSQMIRNLDLGKEFTVGRYIGDFWNVSLEDLKARHFSILFTQTSEGGYELQIKDLSENGTLLEWIDAPSPQTKGSAPTVNFMGTGDIADYLSRLGQWIWKQSPALRAPFTPNRLHRFKKQQKLQRAA